MEREGQKLRLYLGLNVEHYTRNLDFRIVMQVQV